MCRDNAAALPEIECWCNVVNIGRTLRFLSQSFNMGCCQSNVVADEEPYGPPLYVSFEDLAYFRSRCELLETEIQFLEQELQFQRELTTDLRVELHRSQIAQLHMVRGRAVTSRSS